MDLLSAITNQEIQKWANIIIGVGVGMAIVGGVIGFLKKSKDKKNPGKPQS